MSEATKTLREKRNAVWSRIQEIIADADKDPAGLTGERKASFDAAENEFSALTEQLDVRSRADRMGAELVAPQNVEVPAAPAPGAPTGERNATSTDEIEQRAAAFNTYLRRGESKVPAELRSLLEFRDLSDTTGSAGGFTVPQGFRATITERLKYWGPMRDVANVITTTSGQDLPWPNNDDTSIVAAVLGENVQISEADPAFTSKTLKAYVWTSGLVRVPNTLLNDSAFDVEAWLGGRFSQRFGRGQNTAFTNGAGHGSNTAQGIVPGLQAGANLGVTTAGPTAITYADITALKYKIDPAYRANAAFQFSDDAMRTLHLLTDGNGRPLFIPAGSFGSIAQDAPDTLLGKPIFTNNDLAAVAATNVTGLFGDFKAAYIIRDVLDMQTVRLNERYADYLQTGFFAYMRTDGMVDDSYAAAVLTQHA